MSAEHVITGNARNEQNEGRLPSAPQIGRRIVIEPGSLGQSFVGLDELSTARGQNGGSVLIDIWRQETLPAQSTDIGARRDIVPGAPPESGVVLRLFCLPGRTAAPTDSDRPTIAATFGSANVVAREDGVILHRADALHAATVVSGRAELLVDGADVLLEQGDSFVIRGAMHAWRNPFDNDTLITCLVLPLVAS